MLAVERQAMVAGARLEPEAALPGELHDLAEPLAAHSVLTRGDGIITARMGALDRALTGILARGPHGARLFFTRKL